MVVGTKIFTSISLQKLCDVATVVEVTLDYSQTPAVCVLLFELAFKRFLFCPKAYI